MPATAQYTEKSFINELTQRLGQVGDWKVEKEADDGSTDLIVVTVQTLPLMSWSGNASWNE